MIEKIKKFWKIGAVKLLVISLALIIASGFLGSMIQTNFFKYDVYFQAIETVPFSAKGEELFNQNRQKPSVCAADIYKPKDASEFNKYPLIFVVPGIQRTKETQASFCIELARRGYAVICIDPYAQGESTPSYESQSATQEGYGLFQWLDYLFEDDKVTLKQEWNWIDETRIGACGHSAGGNACQKVAEREGKLAKDLGIPSRINGVYITGYIREWTWTNASCNIGISYSKNDEGAFQNATAKKKASILEKKNNGEVLTHEEEWWLTVGNADLRYAEESLEIVNFQLARAGLSSVDEVEIGVDYGNPYEYTYAIINNEDALHALQPYDALTLINLVNFFDYTFDNDSGISPSAHVWWIKEIACGIALFSGFAFIIGLFLLLLRTPFFKSLKKEIPARTGDQKVKGRIIFWISFAISAVLACILYMVCVKWSTELYNVAYTGIQTWNFPQRFTNAVMLWAVVNGLIGIAIYFIGWVIEYLIDRKRASINGVTPEDVKKSYVSKLEPLKLGGKDIGKTLLMAVILIGTFFALDYLLYFVAHIDMRFFFISARPVFNLKTMAAIAMYIPFFFIFYFSNSLRVNCGMRPSNWGEGLSKVISVLGNTLGLVAIIFIEYIPMIATGTIGYTSTVGPQWLFVNLLFSIVPMMAALPLFNRYFFNKTGRVWLGAIVTCVIFIAMTGGATTIYYMI